MCVTIACAVAATSCAHAPPPSPPSPPVSPGELAVLRDALEHERGLRPAAPWKAGLRFSMRDPHSGRTVSGRGGIAVAPGAAVRMILVGGAGSTILDAWASARHWRVAVPPANVLRRGGAENPDDLPIGFLRWWFVAPLAGVVVGGGGAGAATRWVLDDGGAEIDVQAGACGERHLLAATRRASGRTEHVEECRASAEPSPGDQAKYVDDATGLQVDVELESVGGSPDPDAFVNPDPPSGR